MITDQAYFDIMDRNDMEGDNTPCGVWPMPTISCGDFEHCESPCVCVSGVRPPSYIIEACQLVVKICSIWLTKQFLVIIALSVSMMIMEFLQFILADAGAQDLNTQ